MASTISPRPLNKHEYFLTTMDNLQQKHNLVPESALISELMKDPRFTRISVRIFIDNMHEHGVIYQPSPDHYRLVN